MPPEVLRFFSVYIEKELGIHYPEQNYFQLESRLKEIMSFYGVRDHIELVRLAERGLTAVQKQFLVDVATNNETLFFRGANTFNLLKNKTIPELYSRARLEKRKMRIWSAAASYGQEAYSLAITISEMKDQLDPANIEIVGSDISSRTVQRAREGRYSQLEVQRGLSTKRLMENFNQLEGREEWEIRADLRKMVSFRTHNLLQDYTSLGNFDLILCRNVLIYFKPDVKSDILRRMERQLIRDGVLILGNSETALSLSNSIESYCDDGAVYYKRKSDLIAAA